jgi:hypothetical protein
MVIRTCKAVKRPDLQLICTWQKLQSIEEVAMRRVAAFLVITAFCLAGFSALDVARATTGPGCLRVVNVGAGDVLNIRKRPSPSSPVTGSIDPVQQGIISLRGACQPQNIAWRSRWCPVWYFTGSPDDPVKGWVKARFVRDSDCP